MNQFWLVWNERGNPTFKHTSEASARTEAARLARMYPGDKFHVLALVNTCTKNDVIWASNIDIDRDIPF